MKIIDERLTLLIITALQLGTKNVAASNPCLDFMSISLENGTRFVNGSVGHEGLVYPPWVQFKNDAGELRGCPCLVKNCIRMCCKPGEYFDKKCHKPTTNSSVNLSIPSKVRFEFEDDIENHFYVLRQDGCLTNVVFGLPVTKPEGSNPNENFTIRNDGVLVMRTVAKDDGKLQEFQYPLERYCFAWSETKKTSKFKVCLDKKKDNEKKLEDIVRWLETIGNLLSVVCLIITFMIYATFPELRNIHGKTLMCSVACLATAFALVHFIRHPDLQNNVFRDDKSCAFIGKFSCFIFTIIF